MQKLLIYAKRRLNSQSNFLKIHIEIAHAKGVQFKCMKLLNNDRILKWHNGMRKGLDMLSTSLCALVQHTRNLPFHVAVERMLI